MSSPDSSPAPAAAPSTFVFAAGREPHAARAKEILKAHADIRKLAGRNPWSAVLIAALVAFETALAGLLSGQSVWVILLAAWLVGAFASHALWVLIHDCAHNLVVKSGPWNKVFAMAANLPHSSRARCRSRSTTSSTTPSRASTNWTRISRAAGRRASSATRRPRRRCGSSSSRSSSSRARRA